MDVYFNYPQFFGTPNNADNASELYLRTEPYSGVQIRFLYGGGDNIGQILPKFAISRVGMIFQLSKNPLESKRKLSNFQFHVPQQC